MEPYTVCRACHPDNDSFMHSAWLILCRQAFIGNDSRVNQKHFAIFSILFGLFFLFVVAMMVIVFIVISGNNSWNLIGLKLVNAHPVVDIGKVHHFAVILSQK